MMLKFVEVQQKLNCSRSTLKRLLADGRIGFVRIGPRGIRITETELEEAASTVKRELDQFTAEHGTTAADATKRQPFTQHVASAILSPRPASVDDPPRLLLELPDVIRPRV